MDKKDYSKVKVSELYHYGIKGQKWGVRRYQNPDGSLTESGKARYNADMSPKDPTKMSNEELQKANQRLGAESTYRNLTGTTQPGRAITRDTAIKIGATFIGTAAATYLFRKYRTGHWLEGTTNKDGVFTQTGRGILTALLAGGIGALLAGASSLGGSANPISKKEDK